MQPIKILNTWLRQRVDDGPYIFTLKDLRGLLPNLSDLSFKTLLSRAVDNGYLTRVCRGIYLYREAAVSGLVLFHTAALLRANYFNYISLETALSDAGIISQIPINWITLMSSGRSNVIDCGEFGTIEFIHTTQTAQQVVDHLHYDRACKLWRASVPLALRDMKSTHRNIDLIDKGSIDDFVDQLVDEALKNQPNLSTLRIVVEKELLHHEILRVLNQNNLLKNLTFIGGTCLRCCYGGNRLSEDLDFTGGRDFTRSSLSTMSEVLVQNLNDKYGLLVNVSEPIKDTGNVDTWKVKIETRPQQKDLPAQKINIDVCSVPSYEKRPMLLLNPYGVEMGTSGLIIQAQSREEIYADKMIAFALRPNRIKFRDLWDMVWLHQQALKPNFQLIPKKISDRGYSIENYFKLYDERKLSLSTNSNLRLDFTKEMQRFLPAQEVAKINTDDFWGFVIYLIDDLGAQCLRQLIPALK